MRLRSTASNFGDLHLPLEGHVSIEARVSLDNGSCREINTGDYHFLVQA